MGTSHTAAGSAARLTLLPPILLLALVAALLPGSRAQAGEETRAGDTLALVEDEQQPTNIDIAVTIAEETFTTSETVLITRDDRFADALASGYLQDTAPLLMVPTDGPIPASVTQQITDLGATRAVILGGTAAVSAAVEAELSGQGLEVERREGGSRFETAIDVAATDAAGATTAMLARAFPAPGGPESQGFADTLAAGGVAARQKLPILLTQTETLTRATADYLSGSNITTVLVMGGTAAVSAAVTDQLAGMGIAVERVAGNSRDETAIEIAKIAGDESAADAERVIITQGEGENAWASGFALASHAAAFDAPIVLAQDGRIPAPTQAFLDGGVGGDPAASPVLTCAIVASLCEETRVTAGLPPTPTTPFEDIGPVALSLTSDDVDRITFDALPGERIGIGYRDLIAADSETTVCVEMILTDPDGREIAALTNGFSHCSDRPNAAAGSVSSILLGAGGTYNLQTSIADGLSATLEVFVTGAPEVEIQPGDPAVPVSVSRPGEVHRTVFEGQENDQVSIGYRNFVPDDVDRGVCTEIRLRTPLDNSVIAQMTNGFTHCTEQSPSQGLTDAVVLPTDGTYVVEAAMAFGGRADLDLHVTPVVNEPLTLGTPIPVTVDRPGLLHRGTFTGAEGQTVAISYSGLTSTDAQGEVCVDVELRSPTGARVGQLNNGFSDCTGQGTTNVSDPLTLPISGEYVLESTIVDGRTGTMSVRVQ
ncbi:cell wall-binding repeat-containing protein [Euzebya tangerina]|uniref:cell wall-binding repeat-containing protein n=1 Tax=Euzebya tangerina TaxID=591198 RepID=UPI000E30FCD4|nr:cell wall-binding repeat-containing protein [Euzebya tangerina]